MISVNIESKDSSIVNLKIKGHADSAPNGQDLVCAGVSSIAVGLLNALDTISPNTCDLSMASGDVSIKVNQITEENQLILKVGMIQLETIELQNKKFIRIKKVEV